MVESEDVGASSVTPISYSSILQEHDPGQTQRGTRKKLLQEIGGKEFNGGSQPNGVIAHISSGSLSSSDIPVLGNLLLRIGDVKTLNLILQSPGGDGTVVEKFVSLCRSQCKKFRVIIPNEAKSAATMIALGADEIIMGPPSEIGPIDAQVEVITNGIRRLISAQSFIDARDRLLEKYKQQLATGEDPGATMQMLATLDLPFITECERLMDFGRDVARKLLGQYMFGKEKNKTGLIDRVIKDLTSVELFKVHGRGLDGRTARTQLKLNVSLRGKTDKLWQKVWEYYTRATVTTGMGGVVKMFETEHELLAAGKSAE